MAELEAKVRAERERRPGFELEGEHPRAQLERWHLAANGGVL